MVILFVADFKKIKKYFFVHYPTRFTVVYFINGLIKPRVKTHGFMFENTRTIPKPLSYSILPALLQSILQKNLHLPLLFY